MKNGKIEKAVCDYCKKEVEENIYGNPTYFEKHRFQERIGVICIDCLPENREKWREVKV